MAWDGSGNFNRTNGVNSGTTVWTDDKNAGTKILSTRHDTHDQDLADGIEAALAKNGENAATANLNLGGFVYTNAGDGTADTHLATKGQSEKLMGRTTTHDMASDADYTLSSAQNGFGRVVITDTGTLLTTARNIVVSTTQRVFVAQNDTAQTLTFKTSAGTGVPVPAGHQTRLINDGTNVIEAFGYFPAMEADGVLASHKNLAIKNNTTNPNYQVDVDADAVVITNTQYGQAKALSVNLTVDITASGANGLDTGSEANSTWYHIWVIGHTNGTVAGLLSASATAPTMPSGYTYKGYVGAIYNDSGGNLDSISQVDSFVAMVYTNALSGGSASSYTSVSLSAIVPTTAKKTSGTLTATKTGTNPDGYAASTSAGLGAVRSLTTLSGGSLPTTVLTGAHFDIPLVESQTMYYKQANTSTVNIDISGWAY